MAAYSSISVSAAAAAPVGLLSSSSLRVQSAGPTAPWPSTTCSRSSSFASFDRLQMGCCTSSPHARRKYRDPADLDEYVVPEDQLPLHRGGQDAVFVGRLRTFGRYRPNSVWVPDDIDGLPSTHMDDGEHLASDPDTLLYSAEIDNGRACRFARPLQLM